MKKDIFAVINDDKNNAPAFFIQCPFKNKLWLISVKLNLFIFFLFFHLFRPIFGSAIDTYYYYFAIVPFIAVLFSLFLFSRKQASKVHKTYLKHYTYTQMFDSIYSSEHFNSIYL